MVHGLGAGNGNTNGYVRVSMATLTALFAANYVRSAPRAIAPPLYAHRARQIGCLLQGCKCSLGNSLVRQFNLLSLHGWICWKIKYITYS
jgi:hypothetical protein